MSGRRPVIDYRDILENVSEGVYFVDCHRRITFWNDPTAIRQIKILPRCYGMASATQCVDPWGSSEWRTCPTETYVGVHR